MTDNQPMLDRPELQVLLLSVRSQMTAQDIADVRLLLQQDFDWKFLLTEANSHGVLPLLQRSIHRYFEAEIPAPVLVAIRRACERTQQRNLALTAELLRVMRLLDEKAIPALPFKGPVLAALAYGDISLRTFGDLDLLLHEKDLSQAQELLIAQGYSPEHTFTARQERSYRKAECAARMSHPARNIIVELHWALTERYLSIRLPVAQFWERAAPTTLAGRSVLTFGPEDLMLYLCIHGSKHQWSRLEWICCIGELITARRDIDWSKVQGQARDFGVQRLLHLGLILADTLLGVRASGAPWPEIEKDVAARELAREIAGGLFREKEKASNDDRGSWYFYLLRSRERWLDRVRIVLFTSIRLPHPSSGELVALPARLTLLYYVFRPVRLLSASIAGAWRYCVSRPEASHPKGVFASPPTAMPAEPEHNQPIRTYQQKSTGAIK